MRILITCLVQAKIFEYTFKDTDSSISNKAVANECIKIRS